MVKGGKLTPLVDYLAGRQYFSSADRRWLMGLCLIITAVMGGCSLVDQVEHTSEYAIIELGPDDLKNYGIGFPDPFGRHRARGEQAGTGHELFA